MAFINILRLGGFRLFADYMFLPFGIFVGVFGTTLGTIPRCAFASDEFIATPLASFGDFNSATHPFLRFSSVNILLNVRNRVQWCANMCKLSTTLQNALTGLTDLLQIGYKNTGKKG